MKSLTLMAIGGLIFGLAVPAFAGPVGVSRPPAVSAQERAQLVENLTKEKKEAQRLTRIAVKGPTAVHYRFVAVALDGTIERLQRGEQVRPEEIDRALKPCTVPGVD